MVGETIMIMTLPMKIMIMIMTIPIKERMLVKSPYLIHNPLRGITKIMLASSMLPLSKGLF